MRKIHINNFKRTIAYILLVSQFLTSCVRNEEMMIPKLTSSERREQCIPQKSLKPVIAESTTRAITSKVSDDEIVAALATSLPNSHQALPSKKIIPTDGHSRTTGVHRRNLSRPSWQKAALLGMALHNTFVYANRPIPLNNELSERTPLNQHHISSEPYSVAIAATGYTEWMPTENAYDEQNERKTSVSSIYEKPVALHHDPLPPLLHNTVNQRATFHRAKGGRKHFERKAGLLDITLDNTGAQPTIVKKNEDAVMSIQTKKQKRLGGKFSFLDLALSHMRAHIPSVASPIEATHVDGIVPVLRYTYPGVIDLCELSADGRTAFIADVFKKGLEILNMSDLNHISLVGPVTKELGGTSQITLSKDNQMAFILDNSGLHILDISNLSFPTFIGNYTGTGSFRALTLSRDEKTAFVLDAGNSDSYNSLHILNISNLSAPIFIGNYPGNFSALTLSKDEKTAFMLGAGDSDSYNSLDILNISNLFVPTFIGNYLGNYPGNFRALTLSLDEKTAFLSSDEKFQMLTIRDLSHPTPLGHCDRAVGGGNGDKKSEIMLSEDEKTAFLISDNGLTIFKTSRFSHPLLIANYFHGAFSITLSQDKKRAFVVDEAKEFQIFNISNLSQPALMSKFFLKFPGEVRLSQDEKTAVLLGEIGLLFFDLMRYEVDIQKNTPIPSLDKLGLIGNYPIVGEAVLSQDEKTVFITDEQTNTLQMLNVTNLHNLSLISKYPDIAAIRLFPIDKQIIDKQIIFTQSKEHGVQILDVSNLSNLVVIGNYTDPFTDLTDITFSKDGKIAFLTSLKGVKILNITNLSHPALIITYNSYSDNEQYYTTTVTLPQDEKKILVASMKAGLQILNISNLSSPELIGHSPDLFSMSAILSKNGETAFVANLQEGLQIFNIFNLSTPTLIGHYPGHTVSIKLDEDNKMIFMADLYKGLHILNISNLSNPALVGDYEGSALCVELTKDAKTAFVTHPYEGLNILNVSALTKLGKVDNKVSSGIIGDRNLFVGQQSTFWIYPFLTENKNVTPLTFVDYDYNPLQIILENGTPISKIPSWIQFLDLDSKENQLRITPSKEFSDTTLRIILPIKHYPNPTQTNYSNKYYQVFDFPVKPSLNISEKVNISEKAHYLYVHSISVYVNIQIRILDKSLRDKIDFIGGLFGSVRGDFHETDRAMYALGHKAAINTMLLNLRYACKENFKNQSIIPRDTLLEVVLEDDSLNTQQIHKGDRDKLKFLNLGMFKKIRDLVENDNNTIAKQLQGQPITLNDPFRLYFTKKSFTNPDILELTYNSSCAEKQPSEKQLSRTLNPLRTVKSFFSDPFSTFKNGLTCNFDPASNTVSGSLELKLDLLTSLQVVLFSVGTLGRKFLGYFGLYKPKSVRLTPVSITVCAANPYQSKCSTEGIPVDMSWGLLFSAVCVLCSVPLTLYGIWCSGIKSARLAHTLCMKDTYQYAYEEVIKIGESYTKVIPLVKSSMQEAYELWLKISKEQMSKEQNALWFKKFVDENGKIKKEALVKCIENVLREDPAGQAFLPSKITTKTKQLAPFIKGMIAKRCLDMPENKETKTAYEELKARYSKDKKNWYANLVEIKPISKETLIEGNFPIEVKFQCSLDSFFNNKSKLTEVQKELIQLNLLADVRGITTVPVDAHTKLWIQVMGETLGCKGGGLCCNQRRTGKKVSSPFSTAQGESIHLTPTGINEIVAKVYKDTSNLCLDSFKSDREALPGIEKLPKWLKYEIDEKNNLLKLSGTPEDDALALGEDNDGDQNPDEISYYLTITDKADYVVKEFKLTVQRPDAER